MLGKWGNFRKTINNLENIFGESGRVLENL